MRLTQRLCVAASARDDLRHLKEVLSTKLRRGQGQNHDTSRRDIVSQELCDLAVDALRDSLPKANSCDIVEENPGFSRWSRTLHKAIRPRRHVLVEQEPHIYGAYQDSLVADPNGRYHTAPTERHALDLGTKSLSPEFIQRHSTLKPEDRRSRNDQLILVANLVRKRKYSLTYTGPQSKIFLDQYYRAVTDDVGRSDTHRYGLVRLLAWVDDVDRNTILPMTSTQRTKIARELDAAFHIRPIVWPSDIQTRSSRHPWYGANVESAKRVATLPSSKRSDIPSHRRQLAPFQEYDVIKPGQANLELLRSLEHKPQFIHKLLEGYDVLKEYYEAELATFMDVDNPRSGQAIAQHLNGEDLFTTWRKLLYRWRIANNHYTRVNTLALQQIAYEEELLELRQANPEDPTAYLARVEELKPKFEQIAVEASMMFKDDRASFIKAVDDYRLVIHKSVPWHSRKEEPILCNPNDFHPAKSMALLEFTPKESFIARINTADRQIAFDYINSALFVFPSTSVTKLIAGLAGSDGSDGSDLYQTFLSKLPGLSDPLKGGYWDLNSLRLRTLSVDHIIDIAVVYADWPLRKSLNDMLAESQQYRKPSSA